MDFSIIGPLMCILGEYLGGVVAALISLLIEKKQGYSDMERCVMHMRGYRSKMAKINLETWNFAQHYVAVCFIKTDTIVFCVIVLADIILGSMSLTMQEGVLYTLIISQFLLPIILSKIFTEKALRKNFNKDGTRKKP